MINRHQILSSQYKEDKGSSVDMTPLTDVIFILLIFFVVTATFIHETGVDVIPPPPIKNADKDIKNIAIRIEDSNRITLNGLEVGVENITPRISQMLAQNPEAEVIIFVSPGSKANTLVQAIDAAREAGFVKIPVSELK